MTIEVTSSTKGLFDHTDSQDNNWVCFYQIQCLEPHNREKLPKNPFNFWDLHQKVTDLGIKESSPQRGTLLPTFQTS